MDPVFECPSEARRWPVAHLEEMSFFRSSFQITRAGATHRDVIIVHRLERNDNANGQRCIDAFSNLATFSVVTAANFHPQQ
jgi:hypothetical protein